MQYYLKDCTCFSSSVLTKNLSKNTFPVSANAGQDTKNPERGRKKKQKPSNVRVINSVKKPNSTKKRSTSTRRRITFNPIPMLKWLYRVQHGIKEANCRNKRQMSVKFAWGWIQSRAGKARWQVFVLVYSNSCCVVLCCVCPVFACRPNTPCCWCGLPNSQFSDVNTGDRHETQSLGLFAWTPWSGTNLSEWLFHWLH